MSARTPAQAQGKGAGSAGKKQRAKKSAAKKSAGSRLGVVQILDVIGAWDRREKARILQMANALKSKPWS